MKRFKVISKNIRWNRCTYYEGELLPETFTERDMYRVLYPSRIECVEVEEDKTATTKAITSKITSSVTSTASKNAGIEKAEKPVSPRPITGAQAASATK
nr:MAG TPA: Large polyvalent protein associated domain 26 [Caudoviricetes sp.]